MGFIEWFRDTIGVPRSGIKLGEPKLSNLTDDFAFLNPRHPSRRSNIFSVFDYNEPVRKSGVPASKATEAANRASRVAPRQARYGYGDERRTPSGSFQGQNIYDMLQSMSEENNFDIQGIFKPQENLLAQRRAALTDLYNQNYGKLGNMYDAFARGISSREGEVAGNYDTAVQNVDAIGDEAVANVGANYDKSLAAQTALMKQLGIEEAAPSVTDQATEDRAFLQGLIETGNTATENALTSNRASAVDFNKTQANLAGLEGRNRQSELTNEYMRGNSQLDELAAGLQSDRAGMQFQAAQSDRADDWDRVKYITSMMREDQQIADESRAAQTQMFADQEQQQFENASPWQRTYQYAENQLGNQADDAMTILRQVGASEPAQSQSQFINSVMKAGVGSGIPPHILANVASQWYMQAKLPAVYNDQSIE